MKGQVTKEDVKRLTAMNHYERLGVDKSGDSVAIKRAYRIASMRCVCVGVCVFVCVCVCVCAGMRTAAGHVG
jgi:hypothetical protein